MGVNEYTTQRNSFYDSLYVGTCEEKDRYSINDQVGRKRICNIDTGLPVLEYLPMAPVIYLFCRECNRYGWYLTEGRALHVARVHRDSTHHNDWTMRVKSCPIMPRRTNACWVCSQSREYTERFPTLDGSKLNDLALWQAVYGCGHIHYLDREGRSGGH